MRTLLGMPVDVKYPKTVMALTSFVNHGMLILNSLWVLLRLNSMGSLTRLDSLAVLVIGNLPRIH